MNPIRTMPHRWSLATWRRLPGWGRVAAPAWLAALAVATLTPVPQPPSLGEPISVLCLVCGDRGVADAILNIVLFTPFGAILGAASVGAGAAATVGAVVSGAIELGQLVIPGRFATLADILWNASGAALGALGLAALRARRSERAPSALPGWAAAFAWGSWLVAAGWLLAHAPTEETYWGQWTADLGHMPAYRGRLLDAGLDGLPFPDTAFDASARAQERFAGDWRVGARIVKGPPPAAVSPIVSVLDDRRAEIFLLGARGEDLVVRERTRAKALHLDHPDLSLTGALASYAVGDTVRIEARRAGRDRCMSVDGIETCALAFTPGRTWSVFLYPQRLPVGALRLLDVGWWLIALVPVGMLSVSRRSLAGAAAVTAALTAVAVVSTRLVAPPGTEVVGGLVGLALGWLVAGRLALRGSP